MRPECDKCGGAMRKSPAIEKPNGIDAGTHQTLDYLWECRSCGVRRTQEEVNR